MSSANNVARSGPRRKRNTKRASFDLAEVNRPPEQTPWLWIDLERLSSPAWRARSMYCVRLLEFLETEDLKKRGAMNGELLATYEQVAKFGVIRRVMLSTITEAQLLGLIEAIPGRRGASGEIAATKYRLTYRAARCVNVDGSVYYTRPTDDWRSITTEAAAKIRKQIDRQKRESRLSKEQKSEAAKIGKRVGRGGIRAVPTGEFTRFPRGNSHATKTEKNSDSDQVYHGGTTLKNLPRYGAKGETRPDTACRSPLGSDVPTAAPMHVADTMSFDI